MRDDDIKTHPVVNEETFWKMINQIENMKCCGNCKNNEYKTKGDVAKCRLRGHITMFAEVCHNWENDGWNKEKRMIIIDKEIC